MNSLKPFNIAGTPFTRGNYEPGEPAFDFDDTVAGFAAGEAEGFDSLVEGFDESPEEAFDDEESDDVPDFDFDAEASARASVR
jgi:hypothetical protein